MAHTDFPSYRLPTCRSVVREHPKLAVVVGVAMLVLGASAPAIIDAVQFINTPRATVIRAIKVTEIGFGWHDLALTVETPESPRCLRERQDVLIRQGGFLPVYYPLGSARNGMGMGRSGVFSVHFSLPPWISGEWQHQSRLSYTCPVWPLGSMMYQISGPLTTITVGAIK